MNFCSDNTAGAAPEILAAIAQANDGAAMPYGSDDLTVRAEDRIREVFEADAAVLLVATGTAANAIGLAAITPPWGEILCHPGAHIENDECGAPEFFTGGAKLALIPGADGKFDAAALKDRLAAPDHGVHHVKASAVSISQATEAGTIYAIDEIAAIAEVAHGAGLKLHLDGARFANAMVALDCSAAEMSWRAGVDLVSFGASKNGALAAEAIVAFDSGLADELAYRRKRAGHLFSKSRFLAAQWLAYLQADRWRAWAGHANAMARRLADGLAEVPGASFAHPVQANEIFVSLPEPAIQGLEADGFQFYRWPGPDPALVRLVTAFDTAAADVDAFIAAARRHAEAA